MVERDRQVEQQRIALEKGQARRMERTRLLRALEAGHLDPAWLVRNPPACLEAMFVFDFLLHIPRVGNVALRELNRRAIRDQVNLAVALADLPPSRRQWLADAVAEWTPPGSGQWPFATRPQG